MPFKLLVVITMFAISSSSFAKAKPFNEQSKLKNDLLKEFKVEYNNQKEVIKLQNKVLSFGGKSVPALIDVMKSSAYPDKNRWVATFLLGRVMGRKSSPFLSKFLSHPNWVLRMASLKTLLALGERKYANLYAQALKDQSFLVRTQALDNIQLLGLQNQAPQVWAMLYDKKNYYSPQNGPAKQVKGHKRTNLIKKAVKTVGILQFEKALKPLFTMIQKNRYDDIFEEIDFSLSKITGKKSPEGKKEVKRRFWKRTALSYKTF